MDEHVGVNSYVMSGNEFKFNDRVFCQKLKLQICTANENNEISIIVTNIINISCIKNNLYLILSGGFI
jgi:hypothetical protein